MTRPHEDLYRELQDWVLSKGGQMDPRDVAEAVGQMFAASLVAMHPEDPVGAFWRKCPELESMIEEMWAQSAEETA
jgi:hypothetical protein